MIRKQRCSWNPAIPPCFGSRRLIATALVNAHEKAPGRAYEKGAILTPAGRMNAKDESTVFGL